jgi:hypothetical protein
MDLLGLLLLLLVGILGYVYWVQGLMSGLISAVLSVVAALVAVSYHEPLIALTLGGRFAAEATAITLCVIFAATYIILRLVFDRFVPGNARFPALVDHIGGAIGGVVSGAMVAGIIGIAAQSLPLGVTPLGSSRFELVDRTGIVLTTERNQRYETVVENEVKGGKIDPSRRGGLLLPVDDLVLSLVRTASAGSLSGSNDFASVYPDFLDELFAGRLGIPREASLVALNLGDRRDVEVKDLLLLPENPRLPQVDGELAEVRPNDDSQLDKQFSGTGDGRLLVVRLSVRGEYLDKDNRLRFATGSAALVVGGKLYFPVGIIELGEVFVRQYVDDPLVLNFTAGVNERTVDLVYEVPEAALVSGEVGAGEAKVKSGTLFRFKRFGRVDLSGRPIKLGKPSRSETTSVERKTAVYNAIMKAAGRTVPAATPGGSAAPGGAAPGGSVPPGGAVPPAQPGEPPE